MRTYIYIVLENKRVVIHLGYFYSTLQIPYYSDTVSEFQAPQATVSEGRVQGPYVTASNPRPFGREATNLPMSHHAPYIYTYMVVVPTILYDITNSKVAIFN